VPVQDLADQLGPHYHAALLGPPDGALDQVPLKVQQLRRRESVNPQAAVVADPHGPFLEEPVGGLLGLGERLLRRGGDREALG
jgi:hypothetical protein